MELGPDGVVAIANPLCRRDGLVRIAATLHRGQVGQAEGDVLDEDLGVVGPLPIGQGLVDLARLGVDQIRLDPVAVTPEEGVRERAIAPVDAAAMEIDEEERHRVEEPLTMAGWAGRQPHEEPPVLERVGEVRGHEDRALTHRGFGDARRPNGRKARLFETQEHLVLGPAGLDRQLLQGVQDTLGDQEANEMP